jgi:uncharacterized protein YtpQ (UPF0354 family)
LYFYLDSNEFLFPLDIVGYSKIIRINSSYTKNSSQNFSFDRVNQTLNIHENEKNLDTLNIKPIIENLESIYKIKKSTSF